jgi:MFS family permease
MLETAHPDHGTVAAALRAIPGTPLKVFLVCLAIWALTNMDQSLFSYAMPDILRDLNISLTVASYILSIGFGVTIVAVVVIGLATDRFGRRLALACCLAVSGLFVGLQGLADSAITLTVFRTLAFGFSGGLSPITNSLVAENAPPRLRGVMVGLLQCGYPIGWFVASIVVVPLMTSYGWRSIFLVGFVIIAISALVYRMVPESPRFAAVQQAAANRGAWRRNLGELFGRRLRGRTLLTGFAFFAQAGAYASTAFYLPTFFHDVRGYEPAQAARIVGLSYAIGLIGYIGASLIGEFLWTRRNTIIVWCWVGAAAFVGFVWLPQSEAADIFWCGLMAIFFYGAVAVMGTYLLELYPTRLRATGAALGSAFLSLGFASFPILIASAVKIIGWQWAFTAAVVPLLFLCGLSMFGLANIKSGQTVADI